MKYIIHKYMQLFQDPHNFKILRDITAADGPLTKNNGSNCRKNEGKEI